MYKKLPQSVSPPVPFSLILSLSLSLILAFNLSFASPSLSSHECSVVSPSQRSHLRCHFSGVKAEHFLNGEITCVSPGSPLSAAPPLSALTHTHTHTQRAVKSPSEDQLKKVTSQKRDRQGGAEREKEAQAQTSEKRPWAVACRTISGVKQRVST